MPADGKPENANAKDTSHGMKKPKNLPKSSDSKKGKNKERKNKKSLQVPEDDPQQTDAGNSRHQTHSTTLRTNNSDNGSKVNGDRTITDNNPEEVTNGNGRW